jgi:hypothetical protein
LATDDARKAMIAADADREKAAWASEYARRQVVDRPRRQGSV